MKSVWHTIVLNDDSWRASRYEDAVDVEITVASWPLLQLGELVMRHGDAGVANHRIPLISPRDIDPDTGTQVPRECAGLQPVMELDRQLAVGDILLPRSPTTPAVLVTEAHRGFAFSTAFIALRVNTAEVDPRYVWMLLSSSRGMRARKELSNQYSDWEALRRLRVALPPLAVQRAQSVSVPVVRWVVAGSRWHLANLRHSKEWGPGRVDARDAMRLRDLAQISTGAVDDADIFSVPGNSRVSVLTDMDATEEPPRGWANVSPDNVSFGSDIAVSPLFPFTSRRVPTGWAVSRRFLVVRANVSVGLQAQPSVDGLVTWFNSIAGRQALAALASGTVLPRLNVSALSRVPVPESTAAVAPFEQPLAERLERALELL